MLGGFVDACLGAYLIVAPSDPDTPTPPIIPSPILIGSPLAAASTLGTTNDCGFSLRRAWAETPLIGNVILVGSVVQWAMRGRSMCSQWSSEWSRSHCDKRWFEGARPTSPGGPSMPYRYMLLTHRLNGFGR